MKANASLPEGEARKTKLSDARDALAAALGGKTGNRVASIQSTAELVAARETWLTDYTGAKRIIQGLLSLLRRKEDYRLYFKDLQVNEGGGGGGGEPAAQDPPAGDTSAAQTPPAGDTPAAQDPKGT